MDPRARDDETLARIRAVRDAVVADPVFSGRSA
jgi:hypothetical protein